MLKGTQAQDLWVGGVQSENVEKATLSGGTDKIPSPNPKGDREKLFWALGQSDLGLCLGSEPCL